MSIDLQIKTTHSEICQQAAKEIAEQIRTKSNSAIGLATGNTMEPIYTELVRMHKEEGLDFSQVKFFNLDEFVDIEPSDEHSFEYYLRNLFLNKVNAKPENIHLVKGISFSPETYEQEIKDAGGIDIQILGIGRKGHIGFNEASDPTSTLDSRTRKVSLAKTTIEDSAASFGGQKNVPLEAYTQGIGTILDAKKLIMITNGGHKTNITKELLTEGQVTENPARAVLHHPNVSLHMDNPSTELLTDAQLKTHAKMDVVQLADHRAQFEPIRIPMGDGSEVTLPYNADIFLPEVMRINEAFDINSAKHIKGFREMMKNIKETYVGAHQDDTELWVPQAIEANDDAQERGKPNQFLTIIATDGAAYTSALKREGKYSKMTPEMLITERKKEQRNAARNLRYPAIQLQYPSNTVKGFLNDQKTQEVIDVLSGLYEKMPKHETAYTHHPVDIHKTHTACATLSIQALRNSKQKPKEVFGMPAWGETGIYDKIFPLKRPELIKQQLEKFPSQVEMQKRAYGVNGEGAARGKGFLYSPHENSPPDGAAIGIDLSEAVTKSTPLQTVIKEAYAKKLEKHTEMLNDYAAPGSPEASHSRINRTPSSHGKGR